MFIYIALLLIGIISLYYLTRKRHIDSGSLAPVIPPPIVQQTYNVTSASNDNFWHLDRHIPFHQMCTVQN